MKAHRELIIFIVILTAIASWLAFEVTRPFLGILLSAGLIAIAFYPVHEYVKRYIEGESLPAMISTAIVVLCVMIPILFLGKLVLDQGSALFRGATAFLQGGGLDRLIDSAAKSPLARFGLPVSSIEDVQMWLRTHIEQLGSFGLSFVTGLVGNVTTAVANMFMTAFVLFFCFRDGMLAYKRLASLTPLSIEHVDRLAAVVRETMEANIYGVLAVAFVQGVLTGLAFGILSLQSPVFWGVAAALASILPLFGAALVWFPTALVLLVTGSTTKGIILMALGAGVISLSDNVIRPIVIEGRVRLGTLAILVSLLGGLQVFGVVGLFAGPLVYTLSMELLAILREEVGAAKRETALAASIDAREP